MIEGAPSLEVGIVLYLCFESHSEHVQRVKPSRPSTHKASGRSKRNWEAP